VDGSDESVFARVWAVGGVTLAIMVTLLTTFGNEEPDLWRAVERGTCFGV
jgi:hypothetical protein